MSGTGFYPEGTGHGSLWRMAGCDLGALLPQLEEREILETIWKIAAGQAEVLYRPSVLGSICKTFVIAETLAGDSWFEEELKLAL